MISPIHNPRTQPSPPSIFLEGASSNTDKITALVAGIFISLASFFLLPAPGALIISAGAAALIGFCSCMPSGPAAGEEHPRWYQPIIQAIPVFFRGNAIPVMNAGQRVQVGGQPYYQPDPIPLPVAPRFNQGEHVPVGRGHRLPGLDELVPERARGQQAQRQPVIHPVHHQPPLQRNQPDAPPERVPVGRGHGRR